MTEWQTDNCAMISFYLVFTSTYSNLVSISFIQFMFYEQRNILCQIFSTVHSLTQFHFPKICPHSFCYEMQMNWNCVLICAKVWLCPVHVWMIQILIWSWTLAKTKHEIVLKMSIWFRCCVHIYILAMLNVSCCR